MNDEQLNEPTEPTQLQIYSRRIAALKIELAQCKDSRTSWDSVIEQDEKIKKATARIATLEAALHKIGDLSLSFKPFVEAALSGATPADGECQACDGKGCRHCDPEYDPTPWCSGCGARRRSDCHCGPIADNE